MASDLFGTPYIGLGVYATIPTSPSGRASFTGDPATALYDGSNETYATIFDGVSQTGGPAEYTDTLRLQVLTQITSLDITWSFDDTGYARRAAGGGLERELLLWRWAADPANMVFLGSGEVGVASGADVAAEARVIRQSHFDFATPVPPGEIVEIWATCYIGVDDAPLMLPTTFYQIGPVTAPVPTDAPVPWLRVYPRHDQRLYPPTRSLGARPAGYP